MRVRWTIPAVDQLKGIFDYIAADNREAARRTVIRIRQAIQRTAKMPYSGRLGRVAGTREITVPGTPYVVAYKILERMIHVLAVYHGAQEWPQAF